LGSKLKRRREVSGIPREARDPNSKEEENRVESIWDPNSKEEEKQVESQGRPGIQTQKKMRAHPKEEAPYSTPYLLPPQQKLSSESRGGTREEEVGLNQGWKMAW
jgi:hypothetical protein